jgi:uncharacterized delta-60 repeat protein
VVTTFGDPCASASAVVLAPDGRVVVAGYSGAGPYSELNDFALARYESDGSLDPSFGSGGKVVTHFPGVTNTGSRAATAVLQPDGELLVAGSYKNEASYRRFALARYHADGHLDLSFGVQGKVTTSLGEADALANGIALQPDGGILLAGSFTTGRRNHDFALVRYVPDGTVDPEFGDGGRVISDLFGTSDDIAYDLALQTDGKLLVTGRTGEYPNFEFGLARYEPDGGFDPSFGLGGRVMTSLGGFSSQAYSSAIQRDGRIVVTGYAIGTSADMAVARYLAAPAAPGGHIRRR